MHTLLPMNAIEQDFESGAARTAVLRGMVGGAVATAGMSAVMFAAQRTGLLGRMPPRKITHAALDALGVRRSKDQEYGLTGLAHLGYGIGCGALFGWLEPRTRARHLPASLRGAAFASLIWAVSYAGWVPALGIMEWPRNDRPGRPTSMLVAHWVFGSILGALVGRRRESRP